MPEEKTDSLPKTTPPSANDGATANLETKTANDGVLSINKPTASESPADKPPVPNDPPAIEPVINTPTPPADPVVISQDEAEAHDPAQHLSDQIEVLTGEVQALEAKI